MMKLWKNSLTLMLLYAFALFITSCSASKQIRYLQSERLFFTMGDDPGSESQKPYIPKGAFVHVESEGYIPLPILGMIPFGNADPEYVFEKKVLPKVLRMGGNALTNISFQYSPRPHPILGFFGLSWMRPAYIIITGQVVKK